MLDRVVALVAAHQEEPAMMEALLEQLEVTFARAVVLASPGDLAAVSKSAGDPLRPAERFFPYKNVRWIEGSFAGEREKRNALLALGHDEVRSRFGPGAPWLLIVDPDEVVCSLGRLEALLERCPTDLPAFPMLRQERDGQVWAMPSKLFRANVSRYAYLDVAVEWNAEVWDLDPWCVGRGSVLEGWPHLAHLGSQRASIADGWYTEPQPYAYDRAYRPLAERLVEGALIV